MATASINCKDLPINPKRLHYSVENKRMRVFNARFDLVEIEIVEKNGQPAIMTKSHIYEEPIVFSRDKYLKVHVGHNSISIYNETHIVSLSGINSANEMRNLEMMRQILRESGFLE